MESVAFFGVTFYETGSKSKNSLALKHSQPTDITPPRSAWFLRASLLLPIANTAKTKNSGNP